MNHLQQRKHDITLDVTINVGQEYEQVHRIISFLVDNYELRTPEEVKQDSFKNRLIRFVKRKKILRRP